MGVVHAWNLSSWQTQVKNLNKSQLGLYSKFQANWGYKLKPYLNKKQSKTGHLGFYKRRFSTIAKWTNINLDT